MLSWAIIPHLCGVHYWQLRILSIQGQDGQLEMAEMYQWHPTLGYLTHRFSWIPHHKIWRLLIWSTRTLGNGIGGKLFATYDRRTCESILALPLTHQNSHDKLIWKENRSQRFTVRSAYQVALRLKYPNQAEHSSVQAHGSTWRKLWKLNVPPKVRTFLWRACSGCLPTRENLHKKRIRVEERCELCHHHSETISHDVWALFRGTIQKCSHETDDFFLLFKMLEQKLCSSDLEKRAITAWSIWNARNRFYFEQAHPKYIFDSAMGLLEEKNIDA